MKASWMNVNFGRSCVALAQIFLTITCSSPANHIDGDSRDNWCAHSIDALDPATGSLIAAARTKSAAERTIPRRMNLNTAV